MFVDLFEYVSTMHKGREYILNGHVAFIVVRPLGGCLFFVSSHVWMISINQAIFTLLVQSSKELDWSLDTVSCVCDDVMQTVHHIALIVVL